MCADSGDQCGSLGVVARFMGGQRSTEVWGKGYLESCMSRLWVTVSEVSFRLFRDSSSPAYFFGSIRQAAQNAHAVRPVWCLGKDGSKHCLTVRSQMRAASTMLKSNVQFHRRGGFTRGTAAKSHLSELSGSEGCPRAVAAWLGLIVGETFEVNSAERMNRVQQALLLL